MKEDIHLFMNESTYNLHSTCPGRFSLLDMIPSRSFGGDPLQWNLQDHAYEEVCLPVIQGGCQP